MHLPATACANDPPSRRQEQQRRRFRRLGGLQHEAGRLAGTAADDRSVRSSTPDSSASLLVRVSLMRGEHVLERDVQPSRGGGLMAEARHDVSHR
jgi:hypothetical protein